MSTICSTRPVTAASTPPPGWCARAWPSLGADCHRMLRPYSRRTRSDGFRGRPGSLPPRQPIQPAGSNEMTAIDLKGATVVVTGASRGFGRATAVALAESGAQVVGVARHRGGLEELQRELGD
ncbi:MAG TPA: SDR family NAD(P)-dependent oxidoreductase, partial [Streptosporangiaceae bacterium]|nr:SDR family NAD(P)-dependent oxidoreductase [Streptosporangiaceae bacterium]